MVKKGRGVGEGGEMNLVVTDQHQGQTGPCWVVLVINWAPKVSRFVPNMLLASEDIKQKQNERTFQGVFCSAPNMSARHLRT